MLSGQSDVLFRKIVSLGPRLKKIAQKAMAISAEEFSLSARRASSLVWEPRPGISAAMPRGPQRSMPRRPQTLPTGTFKSPRSASFSERRAMQGNHKERPDRGEMIGPLCAKGNGQKSRSALMLRGPSGFELLQIASRCRRVFTHSAPDGAHIAWLWRNAVNALFSQISSLAGRGGGV